MTGFLGSFDPWYTTAWFVGEILLFFLVDFSFKKVNADESRNSIAPQIVGAVLVVKGIQLYSWEELFKGTRHDRLDVPHPGMPQLMMIEVAHCLAETTLAIVFEPPYATTEMVVHRVIVMIMVLCAFTPYAHGFMPFFCGVVHISDVAFIFAALFDTFPALEEKYPRARRACRVLFGVVYFAVRILLWFPIFALFMLDNLASLLNGTIHHGLMVFLEMVGGSVLTYLQVCWAVQLVKAACAWCNCCGGSDERDYRDKYE